jgi:hypothetical protein
VHWFTQGLLTGIGFGGALCPVLFLRLGWLVLFIPFACVLVAAWRVEKLP